MCQTPRDRQQRCIPELMDVKRIGFSASGDWAFVLSKGGCTLHELDLNNLDPGSIYWW